MEQNNPMPYFSSLFTPPSPITSFHQCAMFNNFNLEIVKVFHEQPLTLEFSKSTRTPGVGKLSLRLFRTQTRGTEHNNLMPSFTSLLPLPFIDF